MLHQTDTFLLRHSFNIPLAAFCFFATLCSYSFHWYLTGDTLLKTNRSSWLKKNKVVHIVLFLIGLGGSIYFFIPLAAYWFWLLVAAVASFLYTAPKIPHPYFRWLRSIAYGKTIFLSLVWTYVSTVLPIVSGSAEWQPSYTLFFVYRFFLIYAICIIFDFRDREDDKQSGVLSMITVFTRRWITILFFISIGLSFIAICLLFSFSFSLLSLLLLLLPLLLVGLLYQYATHHFSKDMLYYFVLDGLMALSALLMWVLAI